MYRSIGLIFLILSVLGCSEEKTKQLPDKVTVQLKFVHQAQFAGLYVAIEKGLYAEENIQIEFIEGGRGIDLISPVVDGEAQFGIAASDLILARRADGKPIISIAAIYRRCAAAFVSKVESGIVHPRDMVGKRIAVLSKNAKEYEFQFRAMMKKLGLDISKTTLLPLDHQYNDFLEGSVDVTGAYITGGAMRLKAKGLELNTIWPGDYGVKFYSDTIFVNDDLVSTNPDLIMRFLRATLKGWQEAIGNSEEAIKITLKYARIKDSELQTNMMNAQYPLIHTGVDQIGWMDRETWVGMNRIMYEQNILKEPLADINKVYTMEFLHEVYKGSGK